MPVSVHSDSANGDILLLTNIVYVINKIYIYYHHLVLIDRPMTTSVFFFHCRALIFLCVVQEFVGHCHWRPPFYQYCTCACIDRIIDGTLTVIFYGILLPVRYLKNTIFLSSFEFLFSENRKKILESGSV